MSTILRNALVAVTAAAAVTQAWAQVTLYEQERFEGRSFTTQRQLGNFSRFGLADGASSVVVQSERWEVCEEARFGGRCVVLRPGRYPSFSSLGLYDGVLSVRPVPRGVRVADDRYAAVPVPVPVPAPAPVAAQLTFYEREGFEGRSFTTSSNVGNLDRFGFNDRAYSVVVTGTPWEVCEDVRFGGRCFILRPGRYGSLTAVGLNGGISSVRITNANAGAPDNRYPPAPVPGQVTFYEHENFAGRSFTTTDREIVNFERTGFNDLASSVVVVGAPWEVCQDVRFGGRCVVLRPGRYPSLMSIGLNDRLSSGRMVSTDARTEDNRYRSAPVPVYDSRRRPDERFYEVNVTSVRAVVGNPGQRCWVEREQITQDHGPNVPAAIAGAVIGGILGHQVGGGHGKDIATAGGAVVGAALGAHIGRDGGGQTTSEDIRRCERVPGQARPDYWDVTYNFRGQEHRVQMSTPPHSTITVNERGEPRT